MSENTNECVIEWIPGRDYVGLTAKNGSTWKNRCEELEKEFPDDVKILAYNVESYSQKANATYQNRSILLFRTERRRESQQNDCNRR